MKFILLIILVSSRLVIYGQMAKSETEKRINEIMESGVDTIICFRTEQIGYIPSVEQESCIEFAKKVFIWVHNGKTFFQKLAKCVGKEYEMRSYISIPIEVDSSRIFKFLANHYKELTMGEVVPAVFKWTRDGKEMYQEIRSHHPTKFELMLIVNGNISTKKFENIALQDSVGGVRNLNYAYNKFGFLNLLKMEIEKELAALEYNSAFK